MRRRLLQILMLALSLATVVAAKANPVDMRLAREVGANFISANTAMRVAPDRDLQWVTTYRTVSNDAAFHVFNTPKGFVIVAADDCSTPILGYSEEGHFDTDNVPPQMQEYLQDFVNQIQYGIDNHIAADATIARQWELVQATGHITENRATTSVAPLLSDSWNQGCYYNELCPDDPDGQCYHPWAGCVATSMAQIMHYWSYPTTGTGSHTYTPVPYPTTQYPEQTANFGATTYQWNNMPNSLNSSSSSTQVNAVATLIWHCGVAVEMKYGINGSGAPSQNVVSGLVNYFGYSDDMSGIYKDNYNNDQWLNLIKGSLNLGRPVHYSGFSRGGHAFVCDGYDSDDYLHFNWGWSGSHNGYFALDALTPGSHNYSYNNYAIINIHPNCSAGTSYHVTASASPSYGGSVSGSGYYDCGEGCTLTATPANGYMFCSWTEGGVVVSTEPTYSFTVMDARNLVANFYQNPGNQCALVFDLIDSYGDGWNGNALTVSYSTGCIDSEELTFDSGSSATITRNVVDGSHIVLGWISGNWTDECSFTVSYEDGDVIYEGSNLSSSFSYEFDVNCGGSSSYYISASASPSQGGSVYGGGYYSYGTNCTLTASANSGYTFTKWTRNGTQVSTNSTYSFTVTGDATYVAHFSASSTPVGEVVAEYYPDASNPSSQYVKVHWGQGGIEGFESGDFSMFNWELDGDYPWEITEEDPYEGNYCMKSGNINVANSTSSMSVTVSIPNSGEMSFFSKISSENNYDYGRFYIDGEEADWWCGNGSWVENFYDINAGTHTFMWTYEKDNSVNSYDDCFYIDYISFYTANRTNYKVYRADCNGGNQTLIASNVMDNEYIDAAWSVLESGSYKFGVKEGSSEITWSNCLAKPQTDGCTVVFDFNDSYGDGWNGNCLVVNYGNGATEQLTLDSGSSGSQSRVIPNGNYVSLSWISGNWTDECSFTISYEGGDVIYEGSNLSESFSYGFYVNCSGPGIGQVVAEYYPDANNSSSPYVKVYWGQGGSIENFESGGFSAFNWQLDETYPWEITTNSPYEGNYCMKSGNFNVANSTSSMSVTVSIPNSGQMSFFGIISSENNWDFGHFYIDGEEMGNYSGSGSWTENVFDITAGTHTFMWSYSKDGSVNSNDDCYYVDYISFNSASRTDYNIYRADCDGDNQTLIASGVTGNEYIYNAWSVLESGSYKFGVKDDDSDIVWSNCLTKPETDGCTVVFDFNDSYGDGWNGNCLVVNYGNGSTEQLTLDSGSSGSQSRVIPDGSHVTLGWITGGWISECSFTVSYEGGDIIYQGSNLSSSFSYEFDVDCGGPSVSYTITTTASPSQGGLVSGGGVFDGGTTCSLVATPNANYTFNCWMKNGEVVSTSSTYSFEVTESADYTALFDEIDGIYIGDKSTADNQYLPSYSYYNYTLSQQIYTADELGGAAYINAISFFNAGGEKTRTYDIYMVHTNKSAFDSNSDWITVTEADKVFSGEVTMLRPSWNAITFDTPFAYNGTSNVALIVDDNTGSWESNPIRGRVFDAEGNQALRVYSDNTNYDPSNPSGYNGTLMSVKNQVMLQTSSNPTPPTPPGNYHWNVNIYDYPSTMTVVGIIRIDGVEQMTNALEIGAFCNNECRGRERLTDQYYSAFGHYYVFLTVYGTEGNTISFRLYDHLIGEELDLTCATISFVTNATYGNAANPYLFDFSHGIMTQTSNFASGWNWWSSYVEGEDLMNQLKTGLGANGMQIKSQTQFTQYYSGMWMGALNSINNESSYLVQTNAACTVEMTGSAAQPVNHPITLNHGWNWIGFPNSAAIPIATAFSNINPCDGDQVKSQYGFSQYNSIMNMWIGNLSTITPGMGLLYQSNNNQIITLVYPEGNRNAELEANFTNEDNHWTNNVHAYPSNMTVTAVIELDDVELQGEHYEVAAFANGECRGSARLMYVASLNRYMAFLTIAGDEASELYFSFYDAQTGVEMMCTPSLQYSTNAIVGDAETPYVISFRSTMGIDELDGKINVFPNPVSGGENVTIGLPVVETLRATSVEVVNALGQVVETVWMPSAQTIVAPKVAGVYTLRITVEGKGTYCRKLVVR